MKSKSILLLFLYILLLFELGVDRKVDSGVKMARLRSFLICGRERDRLSCLRKRFYLKLAEAGKGETLQINTKFLVSTPTIHKTDSVAINKL